MFPLLFLVDIHYEQGFCVVSVSLLTFIELDRCADVLALVWLKRTSALLRYRTCKGGLLVCCLVLLASPCLLLVSGFLLPSVVRIVLVTFLLQGV